MIPKECKRLAEVDFPIAAVSRHSAREKSIRHGHPSTLHLWWARRPLAACRSMLMALLLPDPCDPHCPQAFKDAARRILLDFPGRPGRWDKELDPKNYKADKSGVSPADLNLRHALLHEFIADFANWDNAANPAYLKTARALVKAAHGPADPNAAYEPPLVVDPFAGGGSIPLEALRIGCDAFASDLNPVACLINKVLLEDIPRHGAELAEELRRVGAEIKKQAEKELAEFYPADPDGARPIAYLWARTVRCEQPNCGCEIPLVRSWWLCKKAARRRALQHEIIQEQGRAPRLAFQVFTPKNEAELEAGTVSRAKATCPACHCVLSPERVRTQLREQRGGAEAILGSNSQRTGGAMLLAIVTLSKNHTGRAYRVAQERDYHAVLKAQQKIDTILGSWSARQDGSPSPVPDEPTPAGGGSGAGRAFSVQNYGMMRWADMFTRRQMLELLTALKLTHACCKSETLREFVGMAIGRCVDHWSANAMWIQDLEAVAHTFGRQALPIVWDFVEAVGFGDGGASFEGQIDWVARVIDANAIPGEHPGQIQAADASELRLPHDTTDVWFTDPPYYDAVPYADLSNYFYVWHRRLFPGHRLLRDPYDPENRLVQKARECIQDEVSCDPTGRPKDRAFFEAKMGDCFAASRHALNPSGIGCVVFAHKSTEGWEALLAGMMKARWTITASWPITTERPVRLRSFESAALSASIHLVCRPRDDYAGVGDWGEIIRELPPRVTDWMDRLQEEGVRGADLVFACIGPALEIFSRYAKVETAEGREVPLAEYLEKVWEVVGRSALQQILGTAEGRARNGAAGALEEDARLTALFLWTIQSTEAQNGAPNGEASGEDGEAEDDEEEATPKAKKKGFSLIYDVARRFAQPLGIHLEAWEDRIIETDKGVVRLLPVLERAEQLFGEEGASAVADRLERGSGTAAAQLELFPQTETEPPRVRGRGRRRGGGNVPDESLRTRREATTLDRVHAAMLLQAGGRANALRALLKAEVDRSPDFLRLANALSALYPQGSDEKRLLDAMLLAVPR